MERTPALVTDRLEPRMTADVEHVVRIYSRSLPESERKSVPALREMLVSPTYECFVARVNGAVAGFSIVNALVGTSACLLEYMAVSAERRGAGIGHALFHRAVSTPLTASRYVLLEVESIEGENGSDDPRARRHKFYRALGCRTLSGLKYLMPPLSGDLPPPMDMLVYRSVLPQMIAKEQLRAWLEAIYADVYGRSLHDAGLSRMMASLPEAVSLT